MQAKQKIANDIAEALSISSSLKSIFIEEVDSPWNEKAMIKRKRGLLDVKLNVWKETLLLYGRMYRLFLYLYDVLNPAFLYGSKTAPEENDEPAFRERYNQIWSLYVDSRIEKMGFQSFFDKRMRRNLFLDVEKQLSWNEAGTIFEKLWNKGVFTHPEILDYTYNLDVLREAPAGLHVKPPEVRLNGLLKESTVRKHLDGIGSDLLRRITNDLLNYTAYQCKDTYIESSYYGITFVYQRKIFLEMVPAGDDLLFVTIYDPRLNRHVTYEICGKSDVDGIQQTIKECYHGVSMDQQRG